MKWLFNRVVLILAIVLTSGSGLASAMSPEVEKLLPNKIGGFRQVAAIRAPDTLLKQGVLNPDEFSSATSQTVGGEAEYRSPEGTNLLVEIIQLAKDNDAYSLLTIVASITAGKGVPLGGSIGTTSSTYDGGLIFCKGRTFVRVTSRGSKAGAGSELTEFGQLLADQIDKGEGEIPVLVKHLPDWEQAQKRVLFLAGFKSLQSLVPDQSVLSSLDSQGDADAVIATYGDARLLIVEFNRPQLAGDNDRVMTAKIQELRSQNQPIPSSYRRVGNYSVFVFKASEQVANDLTNKVQYEQVVQWLGDNPYWLKEAQRRYTETTLGVLLAVVKASGLTLVLCFGLGGLIGGILFTRRRAQQAATDAFSDAGGMLRLNLDEMTPQTNPARLLPDRH